MPKILVKFYKVWFILVPTFFPVELVIVVVGLSAIIRQAPSGLFVFYCYIFLIGFLICNLIAGLKFSERPFIMSPITPTFEVSRKNDFSAS